METAKKDAKEADEAMQKSLAAIDKAIDSAKAAVENDDDPVSSAGNTKDPAVNAIKGDKMDIDAEKECDSAANKNDAAATPPPTDDKDGNTHSDDESPKPLTQVQLKDKPATRATKGPSAKKTIGKKTISAGKGAKASGDKL